MYMYVVGSVQLSCTHRSVCDLHQLIVGSLWLIDLRDGLLFGYHCLLLYMYVVGSVQFSCTHRSVCDLHQRVVESLWLIDLCDGLLFGYHCLLLV